MHDCIIIGNMTISKDAPEKLVSGIQVLLKIVKQQFSLVFPQSDML